MVMFAGIVEFLLCLRIDWDIGLIAYWNMAKSGWIVFTIEERERERTYNIILFASLILRANGWKSGLSNLTLI